MNTQNTRPVSDAPTTESAAAYRKPSFGDRLKKNLPQKLISFVCALLMTIVVLSDRSMTLEFEQIPVTLDIPDGFVRTGTHEVTVDVKLAGRASHLRGMTRDAIGTLTVAPPPRDGNIQVTLQPTMLSLPDGVRIEKFEPEFIDLNLEPTETRTVAISTNHTFTGELLSGYRLGEVRIEPSEIEITGPRSVVSDTSQVNIEPIDLTGKASTFTVNRWVMLRDPDLKASTESIRVTVNIVSKSKQHIILGVPIIPVNLSRPYTFKPATVDLTLVGDEASLSKVDNANLFLMVDAADDADKPSHARMLTRTELSVPNLPQGVAIDDSKLPQILFTIGEGKKAVHAAPPVPAVPNETQVPAPTEP